MVIFYLRISKLENNQLRTDSITFRVKKLLLKVIRSKKITSISVGVADLATREVPEIVSGWLHRSPGSDPNRSNL